MAGEGSILAMITSLKNNSRRNRRKQFDKNDSYSRYNLKKSNPKFKKATKEQLQKIKNSIVQGNKIIFWKRFVFTSVILALTLLFFIYY